MEELTGISPEEWLQIIPPWLALLVSLVALAGSVAAWRRSAPPVFADVWAVCDGRGNEGITVFVGAKNAATNVVRIETISCGNGKIEQPTKIVGGPAYSPIVAPRTFGSFRVVEHDLKPGDEHSLRFGVELANPFPATCRIRVRMSAMRAASKTKEIVIPIAIPEAKVARE